MSLETAFPTPPRRLSSEYHFLRFSTAFGLNKGSGFRPEPVRFLRNPLCAGPENTMYVPSDGHSPGRSSILTTRSSVVGRMWLSFATTPTNPREPAIDTNGLARENRTILSMDTETRLRCRVLVPTETFTSQPVGNTFPDR